MLMTNAAPAVKPKESGVEVVMAGRSALSSTTMLSGMVGCTFLTASAAFAADLSMYARTPAQTLGPAVDGFNVKLDSYGGSVANRSIYGGTGSLSMPLGGQYGLQIDGNLASLDGNAF